MLKPTRTDGKRPPCHTHLMDRRRHSGERLSDTTQLDDAVAPLVRRAQSGDPGARDDLLRALGAAHAQDLLKRALGLALIASAAALVLRARIQHLRNRGLEPAPPVLNRPATLVIGEGAKEAD